MTPLYMPPSLTRFKPRFIAFSTWLQHMPFAYDLIAATRPKLLVELGTQYGLSFFTFCQSMQENDVDGLCYGVDTFAGDAHTGADDDSVFRTVNLYKNTHYDGFAYLMQMYFNQALAHFDEDTIDILHIDGLHTYDAVAEDFRTWYPKVRPGGLVLFHDVRARLMDFGVWKLWDELTGTHETFTFNHGFGLGVLRKPGGDRSADSELVQRLFDPAPGAADALRAFYVHAARHHELLRQSEQKALKRQQALAAKLAEGAAVEQPAG